MLHLAHCVAAWAEAWAETAYLVPIAISIVMSFDLRMYALLDLRKRPEYRQFAVARDGATEPDLVEECLLAAAGRAEIIELEGKAAFDPGPLLALALQLSPIEGNA